MAKVFLDTNCYIDSIHRKPEKRILELLEGHIPYISPLSIHIFCYIFNIEIPDIHIIAQLKKFQIVEFSARLLYRALDGPTSDFEDNVQLHSAAEAECDLFLTEDKKLRDLAFFGKTRIDNKVRSNT